MPLLFVPDLFFRSAAGTADSTWQPQLLAPEFDMWLMLNGKPTRVPSSEVEWSKVPWAWVLSSTLWNPSEANALLEKWILSLPDSLVPQSRSREDDGGPRTSAGSGLMSGESSRSAERRGCSLKTCRVCCLAPDDAVDAYVGGIIDGEGSITIGKGSRERWTYFTTAVHLEMSTKALNVVGLVARYGGTCGLNRQRTTKHSATAAWRVHGNEAVCFLRRIRSHLRLKRPQADLVIELYSTEYTAFGDTGKYRWTPDRKAAWNQAYDEIRQLNARGPQPVPADEHARLVGNRWIQRQESSKGEHWEEFSGTWPRAGGLHAGTVFRQEPAVPRTSAIVSSCSLPTPTASPYGSSQNGVNKSRPSGGRLSLAALAERELIATPVARDHKGAGRGDQLPDMLEQITDRLRSIGLLPTPTTGDKNQSGTAGNLKPGTKRHSGATLTDVVVRGLVLPSTQWGGCLAEARPTGRGTMLLAPSFVDWMMSLPLGWEKPLPPPSTPSSSISSATASRGRPQRSRSSSSGTDSTVQLSMFDTTTLTHLTTLPPPERQADDDSDR